MTIEKYTGIENFDFQILRLTGELKKRYPTIAEDLETIRQIDHDFETWYQWWSQRAEHYRSIGQFEIAMTYYRASLFYPSFDDTRKQETYLKYRDCFELFHSNDGFQFHRIPYSNGYLPAVFIPKENATKTLLVIGGFDSYMEELVSWFLPLQENVDYNLLLFDGPGQGSVPFQKLYLEADYEKVVKQVLDYFALEEVDAIGLSWGGYFVLKAASREQRINKCIAFDIFYSAMDTLKLQTSPVEYSLLNIGLLLKQKTLINRVIGRRMTNDLNLRWMVQHGQNITGQTNPFDMINQIKRHNISPYLELIKQDCLLLAGSHDMYVPSYRLKEMEARMVNARKLTTRLFTEETGGVLHCQIDNIGVAFEEIQNFLTSK
ncbi:alpha/beta fold hydrolase [Bifidobacterium moukalabense]|uniref:alpha/beta fold hydrolase n=1 Tax=Bifidobacterium moukalabense TaxID=1333651 RepID=UPI0010F58ADB|nr:alpha/beta hydrolase [Bifidobacterium moukalabense]